MTTTLDKVIYTARAHTDGGRDGKSRTDDGLLDVRLDPPPAMGGKGTGTNPEQLFAAGYSACFVEALKAVASKQKIELPRDRSIDAEVDIGPTAKGFGIAVRMTYSPARHGAVPGPSAGGRGASGVPVLQRHARQHSGGADAGLMPWAE